MDSSKGEPYLPPPSYEVSSYYAATGGVVPPSAPLPPPPSFPSSSSTSSLLHEQQPLLSSTSITIAAPVSELSCQSCFTRPATARCDKCQKLLCPMCITPARGLSRYSGILHCCPACAERLRNSRRVATIVSSMLVAVVVLVIVVVFNIRNV